MKNYIIQLCIAGLVLLTFCKSEDDSAISSKSNSGGTVYSINLTVRDSYVYTNPQNGQQSLRDSLLPGATVKVFRTQANMNADTSPFLTSKTNSKGEISLNLGNNTGDFYVKAWHPKISQSAFQFVNINSTNQPGILMQIKI
jgi:hypothetical protein